MEESKNENYFKDSTKELMRSAAGWMRGYAIVILIFLAIIVLGLIIMSATPSERMTQEIFRDAAVPAQIVAVIQDMFGFILLVCAIIVALFGYGIIKLLSASNNFTAISYTEKKEDIISLFKNFKTFWMFYGVSLIASIVFGIIFLARIIMAVQ